MPFTPRSHARSSFAPFIVRLVCLSAIAACAHEAPAHTQPDPRSQALSTESTQSTEPTESTETTQTTESAEVENEPSTEHDPARGTSVAPRINGAPGANADDSAPASSEGSSQEQRHTLNIAAFMRDHFVITAWARDAVAEGDLAALREPLRELAEYKYPGVIPGAWMQYLSRLQTAAKLTAEAKQLPAAAAGVATMARLCGECHIQHRVELSVSFRTPSEHPEPETESLSTRMYRHQWASTRLWEGLTAPSDEAWAAGAKALAEIPAAAPTSKQGLSPQALGWLKQVQELGAEAAQANTLDEKATSYGRLLSMCSECHAARSSGVQPGPVPVTDH